MCRSMVDIHTPTADIRRGKKEGRRRKEKSQGKNIMACPTRYGGHNDVQDKMFKVTSQF